MSLDPPLDDLYKDIILEHYRSPRNPGRLTAFDVEASGNIPVCGDKILLQLRLNGDTVEEVGFVGTGCSISQSSASLMTEAIKGRTLEDIQALGVAFKRMMRGEVPGKTALGDLEALSGVAKFPVRIKCALLAWVALEEGIHSRGSKSA